MSTAHDARFWDRTARKYALGKVTDPAGYERTLDRTQAHLKPSDRVLELGCGTGTTALRLASAVEYYLATDISAGMIAIAEEKLAASPLPALAFRVATAEGLAAEPDRFDVVLGFNYLHLVRDVGSTLGRIQTLLPTGGLFISKTPCVGDMNPLVGLALPLMRAIGKAPHASIFRAGELERLMLAAGFDILVHENHATGSADHRPYIVARRK